MKQIKKPVLALATIGIVGASTLGVSLAAHAQSSGGNTLVDKVAQKFNLNKDDVQKVFDQDWAERDAERQQKMEEKLTQAVQDGKITSEQKDKIVAKLKEMKTFMDSLKDKSVAERRSEMKAKRAELKQWAKDNNIPERFLMPGGMHAGPGSHRPGEDQHGPGDAPTDNN